MEGAVEARNVDVHGFSHCVYSQREPKGGEGTWYPYAGYHKYHDGLAFLAGRLAETVAIGDNLEAETPLQEEYARFERRETMTLEEWLACMEVAYEVVG